MPLGLSLLTTGYMMIPPQNKTNGDISRIPVPSNKEITIPV